MKQQMAVERERMELLKKELQHLKSACKTYSSIRQWFLLTYKRGHFAGRLTGADRIAIEEGNKEARGPDVVQDAKIYESKRKDFFVYSDIYGLGADAVRQISKSIIMVLQILTCAT